MSIDTGAAGAGGRDRVLGELEAVAEAAPDFIGEFVSDDYGAELIMALVLVRASSVAL